MLTAIHPLLPATQNPTTLRRETPIRNPFLCFCYRNLAMSASKVIAEYAKSNRSTCKQCSEKIGKDAPRLGLVSRDARGYDMTKWHHLKCFPAAAAKVGKSDEIQGFDSLKSGDQEALEKLMSGCDKASAEKVDDEEENELKSKNSKKRKAQSVEENETELSALDVKVTKHISFSASDVKSKYKDATLLPKWKAFETLIFLERDDGLKDSSKIAAFDFDGCLANTNVKRVGANAWSLMYPCIPDKLQSLYNDGYKLVIFTNESNIERWTKKRQVAVDSKLGRLHNFLEKVEVPIQGKIVILEQFYTKCNKKKSSGHAFCNYRRRGLQLAKSEYLRIFVACGFSKSGGQAEDPFRKPQPGMWRIMEQHLNSGISVDMNQSFYVGDAAGREGDHSDADIKFAQAIGLKFYVPEEYFEQP